MEVRHVDQKQHCMILFAVLNTHAHTYLRAPPSPCIIVAFDHKRRRVKLGQKELSEFTARVQFGTMYINYCEVWEESSLSACGSSIRFSGMVFAVDGTHSVCVLQVGKHLLEAFQDGDEVVGDDSIRPQSHLSADAKLFLGRSWDAAQAEMAKRDIHHWFEHGNIGKRIGIPWGSPRLAIGYGPIAELDRFCPALLGLDDAETVAKISKFPTIVAMM